MDARLNLKFISVLEFSPFEKIINSNGITPFDIYFKRQSALAPKKIHLEGSLLKPNKVERLLKNRDKFFILKSSADSYDDSYFYAIDLLFQENTYEKKKKNINEFINLFFSPCLTIGYALNAFEMNFPISKKHYATTSEIDIFHQECSAFINFIIMAVSGCNNKEVVESHMFIIRESFSKDSVDSNVLLNIDVPVERLITYSLIDFVNEYLISKKLFGQIVQSFKPRQCEKKVVA